VLELQAQVAEQSVTAAALTLGAQMEMLRELRDKADQRGQTSAAIRAEELRGQLSRFYVKQVETGEAGDFSRMSTEELRAYVYGEKLPAKDPVKHRPLRPESMSALPLRKLLQRNNCDSLPWHKRRAGRVEARTVLDPRAAEVAVQHRL
jgi:hypothetical protein